METITQPKDGVAPASMESGINAFLTDAEAGAKARYLACEEGIRRSPVRAVLGGVAAGYCLHRLPLRELAVANVRLVAALAPPALLFYGAAKVYEWLQGQACGDDKVGFYPMEKDG